MNILILTFLTAIVFFMTGRYYDRMRHNYQRWTIGANVELTTRLKGDEPSGYAELSDHPDNERDPEHQYRLRKQLADRQNEITLLNTRINELESYNRRRNVEERKEEVDEEDEKGDQDDINEFLLSSKKK
mmetsp:Transcript_24911/g.22103  ORF Transcript_24911/g.22103 Transcript_24911/m.22103 type:complete len:130 (+) Transcript_24911:49-438(+)